MNITGDNGIYNSQTREGYSRNAAYNVMQHDKQVKESNSKNLDEIEFENIRYSKLQQANKDEYIKDAKIYAEETINALSKNGKVSKEQFIPKNTITAMREMLEKFFSVLDLNNDGYIDLNENTVYFHQNHRRKKCFTYMPEQRWFILATVATKNKEDKLKQEQLRTARYEAQKEARRLELLKNQNTK